MGSTSICYKAVGVWGAGLYKHADNLLCLWRKRAPDCLTNNNNENDPSGLSHLIYHYLMTT